MIDLENLIFDSSCIVNYDKNFNRVSKIHKYWSRKPFDSIEHFIKKYTKEGDFILDPFCGSASTGLCSILNGRNYVGYDLNPSAIFISKCTLDCSFKLSKFREEKQKLIDDLKDKIMNLYTYKDKFILYSIVGTDTKEYNTVVCDSSFQKKEKVRIDSSLQSQDFSIPEGLHFPDKPFPKKFYKDRFSYKGVTNVSDMFTKRNLLALTVLYNYIHNSNFVNKELFLLAFSNSVLHASKLKSENVRPLSVNNYWIPDDYIEENVIFRFLDRLSNIEKAKIEIEKKAVKKLGCFDLKNKSSLDLADISNDSVDYIITDPPYGDAIQYSELSFVWNCWLGHEFNTEEEVIINPVQGKGYVEFQDKIKIFIENAYRVLKKGSKFTMCFQNKDVKIWLKIIQSIKDCGFSLFDIKICDTFGNPFNKYWAKFSPKADLYVTFEKGGDNCKNVDVEVTPEQIINDIISNYDQSTLDMNKIYDLFVANVIYAVFLGKKINNLDNWSLKKIVKIYEDATRTTSI